MFSMKDSADKKKPRRVGASYQESAVTIITQGCQFNGKLYCRGSSRIGGRIEGEIISDGLLIIEEEASISAKIKVEEAIIQGHVTGFLEAITKVELDATCVFDGDIVTPCLVVKEGATFNGRASMPAHKKDDKAKVEPILKKSAAAIL